MKKVSYNHYYDLIIPEKYIKSKNPKRDIIDDYGEIPEDFLSPRRATGKFSEKSGPKGSRRGY